MYFLNLGVKGISDPERASELKSPTSTNSRSCFETIFSSLPLYNRKVKNAAHVSVAVRDTYVPRSSSYNPKVLQHRPTVRTTAMCRKKGEVLKLVDKVQATVVVCLSWKSRLLSEKALTVLSVCTSWSFRAVTAVASFASWLQKFSPAKRRISAHSQLERCSKYWAHLRSLQGDTNPDESHTTTVFLLLTMPENHKAPTSLPYCSRQI